MAAGVILLLSSTGAAHAAPLYSVWTFEPVSQPLPTSATWNKVFLEERLLPLKLVRLIEPAAPVGLSVVPAGTLLYEVFGEDGRSAYCTIKDRSAGHVARSLFIPALDRRACFLDSNGDGKLDASFGVFDKYGSIVTPSGNMSSARPIPPAAFEAAEVHQYPVRMIISFILRGNRPEKAFLDVKLDKQGTGKNIDTISLLKVPRGRRISSYNVGVNITSANSSTVFIDSKIDNSIGLKGFSDATFLSVNLARHSE